MLLTKNTKTTPVWSVFFSSVQNKMYIADLHNYRGKKKIKCKLYNQIVFKGFLYLNTHWYQFNESGSRQFLFSRLYTSDTPIHFLSKLYFFFWK